MKFTYEIVWNKVSAELSQEIVAFWLAESALPDEENPLQRSKQAIIAMRDEQGVLAGVSTGIVMVVKRLRQPMYYYRTFCAERFRNNNTSIPMMRASQEALREYNLGLDKPEAIGILIEVESELLSTHYTEAFWAPTSFSFIGYSSLNLILRAYYFPGFVLMKPVPLNSPIIKTL